MIRIACTSFLTPAEHAILVLFADRPATFRSYQGLTYASILKADTGIPDYDITIALSDLCEREILGFRGPHRWQPNTTFFLDAEGVTLAQQIADRIIPKDGTACTPRADV